MSVPPESQEPDAIEEEVISTDGTVIAQAFRWSLLGLVLLGAMCLRWQPCCLMMKRKPKRSSIEIRLWGPDAW